MDQQKTGALIAEQRRTLGLTQKQLADKLNISDRTVSKWERGAGFPDISLIEPLADELNLSVLEIFHGQREISAPEREDSAREILNICKPQIERKMARARRWLTAMAIVLAVFVASMPWLISTANGQWLEDAVIPAEAAVEITPEILISTADLDLMDLILENEAVSECYNTSFSERVYLTGGAVEEYRNLAAVSGNPPLFMDIVASFHSLTVSYGNRDTHIVLNIHPDTVTKQVILTEYPYLNEDGTNVPMGQRHGNRIDLTNENNVLFRQGGYKTGWLEYFRTTWY